MENNTSPAARSTHTATVASDNLVHSYVASMDIVRCRATGDITRLGRNFHDTVTCPTCHADLTRLRTR